MIEVEIARLLPKFILQDQNGIAMAKAIETGLQIFCQTIQTGISTILDIDSMPEWRLDEMAWELNCLYDYNADVSSKRAWINNAISNETQYGTKEAVLNYLKSAFPYVVLEESWEYGGDPFHFRVSVDETLTAERKQWAEESIEKVKNVRSVLDDVMLHISATIAVEPSTDYNVIHYYFPGDEIFAGQIPQDAYPV